MASSKQQATNKPERRPGFFARLFEGLIGIVLIAFFGLLLNIIIEWLGMGMSWWELPGSEHSRAMLEQEFEWLGINFEQSLVSPPAFAASLAQNLYSSLFIWQGQDVAVTAIKASDSGLREYLIAGVTVCEIFAVRVAVIVLSLPLFAVFGWVALADGLVERELRRWGGGREAGDVFATAKRTLLPSIVLPILLYLGLPISIHPSLVIIPFASVFAFAIWVTAASFKKYFSPW